jgi:serine/threonine protein kinase
MIDGSRVELAVGTRLGSGQQGEVLQVSDEAFTDCCLKIMFNKHEFDRELAVLKTLQGVPGVVVFRGSDDDTKTIMTSPVHKKTLQKYKGDAACLRQAWNQLTRVIEIVHEKGFAYRDFRGTNILVEEVGSTSGFRCRVYLTDFGSAVHLDEPHLYEGTLRHGAGSVLRLLEQHGRQHEVACSRATELESLVKMMYILENKASSTLDDINPAAEDGCMKLRVWWGETEKTMDDTSISRLISARRGDYARLH